MPSASLAAESNPGARRSDQFALAPPASYLKWLELRVPLEAASLLPAAPLLFAQRRGDGHRVIVIPGYQFGERSTYVLRTYLRLMGYGSECWGLGVNRGRPEDDAQRLVEKLNEEETESPFSLVGWSLGGVIARLVASELPERTRQVITMGTPVEGGPKYTAAANIFAKRNGIDLDAFELRVHRKNSEGLRPSITAIYSRTDGVVGWRAAIDRYNPQTRHLRVPGSHVGLGVNPLVLRAVAQALARRPDA